MSKKNKEEKGHSNKADSGTKKTDNMASVASLFVSIMPNKPTLSATFLSRAILTVCSLGVYIFLVVRSLLNISDIGTFWSSLLFAVILLLMFVEILFPGDPNFSFFAIFFGSTAPMGVLMLVINSIAEVLGYELADNDNAMWAFIIADFSVWIFNVYVGYKWYKERREQGYCIEELGEILGEILGIRK